MNAPRRPGKQPPMMQKPPRKPAPEVVVAPFGLGDKVTISEAGKKLAASEAEKKWRLQQESLAAISIAG
jgi:hypothetical protein